MHRIGAQFLCLCVPGFQRQVFKHVKILSERTKESKEQKKNKGSVIVAESAYNAQKAQFGLVMFEKLCIYFLTLTRKVTLGEFAKISCTFSISNGFN